MKVKNMKMQDVINSWINNSSAKTANNSISTNGSSIFSYDLEIGYTDVTGAKVARDYSGVFSRTTTRHVGAIKSVANVIEEVGRRYKIERIDISNSIVKKHRDNSPVKRDNSPVKVSSRKKTPTKKEREQMYREQIRIDIFR
jgi:hypothetical protein